MSQKAGPSWMPKFCFPSTPQTSDSGSTQKPRVLWPNAHPLDHVGDRISSQMLGYMPSQMLGYIVLTNRKMKEIKKNVQAAQISKQTLDDAMKELIKEDTAATKLSSVLKVIKEERIIII